MWKFAAGVKHREEPRPTLSLAREGLGVTTDEPQGLYVLDDLLTMTFTEWERIFRNQDM
jgi:hypothetical protein